MNYLSYFSIDSKNSSTAGTPPLSPSRSKNFDPEGTIQQLIRSTPDAQAFWGNHTLKTLQNIARQHSPSQFYRALLRLQKKLQLHGNAPAALTLGDFIQTQYQQYPSPILAEFALAAQQLNQAIKGDGNFAPRLEIAARQLLLETSSPALLAGVAASRIAFRSGKILGKYLFQNSPALRLRNWGAGLTGFALEGAAFPTASLLTDRLLHIAHPGQPQSWQQHFASGYLTMAGIHLGSLLAVPLRSAALSPVIRNTSLGSSQLWNGFAQKAIPTFTLYGGLVASQLGHEVLLDSPHQDLLAHMATGLATLVNLKVLGNVHHRVLPKSLLRFEKLLDRQFAAMEKPHALFSLENWLASLQAPQHALATTGPKIDNNTKPTNLKPILHLQMAAKGEDKDTSFPVADWVRKVGSGPHAAAKQTELTAATPPESLRQLEEEGSWRLLDPSIVTGEMVLNESFEWRAIGNNEQGVRVTLDSILEDIPLPVSVALIDNSTMTYGRTTGGFTNFFHLLKYVISQRSQPGFGQLWISNDAFAKHFGYGETDIAHMKISDLIQMDSMGIKTLANLISTAGQNVISLPNRPYRFPPTMKVKIKNGEERSIVGTGDLAVIKDRKGNQYFLGVGIWHPINEGKKS